MGGVGGVGGVGDVGGVGSLGSVGSVGIGYFLLLLTCIFQNPYIAKASA